jgi:hypothetical protein
LRKEVAFAVLCAEHGISRKTGYKWLARDAAEGAAGLADRSRARHMQSPVIAAEVAAQLRALRREWPSGGPRKLLARLALDHPERDRPAASTVGDLLRRKGLSQQRDKPAREPGSKRPRIAPAAANDSWAADSRAGSAPAMATSHST